MTLVDTKVEVKYYPKIFEIFQIIPSPFDGGGCGWGWTKQRPMGPPSPSSPPAVGRGDLLETSQRKLEINSQTFWCKYLTIYEKEDESHEENVFKEYFSCFFGRGLAFRLSISQG